MKRIAAFCALTITATALTSISANAAERPTSLEECAKPTAKAHAPATVRQPKRANRKLATTMTITTNCGVITIAMNPAAPQTVTNMAALARARYFDKSYCHRLTTERIFVLQCGDPSAQGRGSPGSWTGYKDENLPKGLGITYPAGTVAMANSGPNTNGSQFFLVYKDTALPAKYTIWGKITSGLPLLLKIEEIGAYKIDKTSGKAYYAGDGYPVQPVEIKTVRVR
jgi:peptidyl-prolyl cis-trans isomerase B (cyclophilin B)|uniref:peptidylprolyl isomerase n=1 Tax=Candidatus Planktophila sp. TaxID=2175601 RepID=UPI00404B2AAF